MRPDQHNTSLNLGKVLGLKRGTIGFEALVAIAWRVSLLIMLLSASIYFLMQNRLENRLIDKIRLSAEGHAFKESELFKRIRLAHDSAINTMSELMRHQPVASPQELAKFFHPADDGTLRTNPELFEGKLYHETLYIDGTGGIIPNVELLTDEKRGLLLNGLKTAVQVGKAHYPDFLSYYFFTPASDLIIRAPEREDKLLFYRRDAPATFSMATLEPMKVTLPENNPAREFRCTSLQPLAADPTGRIWTTGCHTPFDWQGQHMGAFGSSIRLATLTTDSIANPVSGGENMIITTDGKLIAHPRLTLDGINNAENLDIPASANQDVKAIYDLIQQNLDKSIWVKPLESQGLYIAAAHISGLNAFYVVAYPQKLIANEARQTALNIFYLGLAALILTLLTLARTMKRTVTEPLNHLIWRTRELALGKFKSEQQETKKSQTSEIYALAQSTERMAAEIAQIIGTLEQTVDDRTKDLEHARDVAERASAAKTNFLANMSHEIRTPLTGMIGTLDLLAEEDLSPLAKSYLQMAQKSSVLLLNLVNDILDISRLEAGKFNIRPVTTCMVKAVAETTESLKLLARQKQLKLELETDLEKPLWVSTDLKVIRQILINLVGNAIKFTEKGKITIRMDASFKEDTNGSVTADTTLIVEDTGRGLSPEQIDRLFERFERFEQDDPAHAQHDGTGLGLAIVHELVSLLGGSIECESIMGEGTIFTVTLPLQMASLAEQADAEAAMIEEAKPRMREKPLHGIHLIGVDDNPINRVIIQRITEQLGANVKMLDSGADMFAYVSVDSQVSNVDAYLMDINMPGMNGIETLAAIRGLPGKAATIPAIALTADAIEGTHERLHAAGMDGYVTKPINPAFLAETILTLVKKQVTDNPKHETENA